MRKKKARRDPKLHPERFGWMTTVQRKNGNRRVSPQHELTAGQKPEKQLGKCTAGNTCRTETVAAVASTAWHDLRKGHLDLGMSSIRTSPWKMALHCPENISILTNLKYLDYKLHIPTYKGSLLYFFFLGKLLQIKDSFKDTACCS